MKFLSALILVLICISIPAQNFTADQSSSSLEWETISNKYVKLIYPTNLKDESTYIANLIEHYSSVVGNTYNIVDPKSFTLVLRPELALPNGFVGYGPRRSEWFSSSSFSKFIGSSEWYQTLAIHEYRHINQLDKFDSTIIRIGNFLFGDLGKTFFLYSGLQPWFLEGDAVWAETKYTDAGRGRSPYFLSRLKALVLSNNIPTYNELVNGSYNSYLPNHYVYGYVLISSATKKFGEDFWNKVIEKVASSPHPYRIYSAFKEVSGISFWDFYDQTIIELRLLWGKDLDKSQKETAFRLNKHPYKVDETFYYLHKELDSYWTIYKKNQTNTEKIYDIAYIEELSQLNISENFAVYNEFNVDKRYAYKGSSDIILLDLKNKSKKQITSNQRFYNPKLSQDATKIIATSFTKDQKWGLTELDLNGNILREIFIDNFKFSEANYINNDEVVAILNDKSGFKSIQVVNLNSKKVREILPASRNNIYSLNVDLLNNVLFEAQYKGYVNIFKINLNNSGELKQCTKEKIAAYTPFSDGQKVYYSSQDSYGSKIVSSPLSNCEVVRKESLINFNYLSNSPSDNYNNFPIQNFDNQADMYSKNSSNYKSESYGDLDSRLFTPHSWNFFGARGFLLSGTTNNYLRTMGFNVSYGRDSEEDESYGEFSIDYKRFYPLFNFSIGSRNRDTEVYNYAYNLKWNEKEAKLTAVIPYSYSQGLFNFDSYIYSKGSYLENTKYELKGASNKINDDSLIISSAGFYFSFSKQMTDQAILNPYLFSLTTLYSNAQNTANDSKNSYRFNIVSRVNLPGFFKSDGFYTTFTFEKKKDDRNAYQFLSSINEVDGYVFSRGYDYEAVANFKKYSINYSFLLGYPDFDFSFLYILKAQSNIFFDSTKIDSIYAKDTLDSYGLEINFETKIFRILPLDLGVRYIHTLKDNNDQYETFVGSSVNY